MRLIKLILQDYKAFAGKHEVEIRPLNILIGRNNSGKSALLHAPLLVEQLVNYGGTIASPHTALDLFHGKPYIGSLTFGAILQLTETLNTEKANETENNSSMDIQQLKEYKITEELSITPPNRLVNSKGKKISIKTENLTINTTEELNNTTSPSTTLKQLRAIRSIVRHQAHANFNKNKLIKIEKPNNKKSQPIEKSNNNLQPLDTNYFNRFKQNPFSILNASTNHDWLLFEQVSDWYKKNMGGWRLKKEEFDTYYAIRLVPPRGLDAYRESYTVDFEDAGTGMSAVLPMVVLSHLWRVGGAHISDELPPAIFLAEEPEHHLHPAAHGPLADLFIDLITNDSPHTVMVETHSEVFCLRAQRRVADGTIKPEDVIIHWMDDSSEPGMTRIVPIYIDEHGDTYRVDEQGQRFHFWPPGIFSEDYEEIREIEKLRRESKG